MTVTEIKHAAKRQEWQERIMECRNSGEPVPQRCAERQICPTTYYRWEREIYGSLGKKGRASQALAVAGPEFAAVPAIKPRGGVQVIMTVRTGTAETDIHAGAGEQEIEAVLPGLLDAFTSNTFLLLVDYFEELPSRSPAAYADAYEKYRRTVCTVFDYAAAADVIDEDLDAFKLDFPVRL